MKRHLRKESNSGAAVSAGRKRGIAHSRVGLPLRPRLTKWLEAPGSLTAHLSSSCSRFSVSVLRQGKIRPWPEEVRTLGLRRGEGIYGREVLLCCDGQAVVLARSVLSMRASRLAWRAIRGLGSRPLADILFGHPAVSRTPLEIMRFHPRNGRTRQLHRLWKDNTDNTWATRSIWARKSCFTLRGLPMLVTECFEPTVAQLRSTKGNFIQSPRPLEL